MNDELIPALRRLGAEGLPDCFRAADAIASLVAERDVQAARIAELEDQVRNLGREHGELREAAEHNDRVDAARIAELEQRCVMLATENTDLRELLNKEFGSGWEDWDAACYRAQQRQINQQTKRIAELNEQLQAGDHIRAGLEVELTRVTAALAAAQEKKP